MSPLSGQPKRQLCIEGLGNRVATLAVYPEGWPGCKPPDAGHGAHMLTGEEDETRTMHVPADHAHKVLPAKDIQPNQAGGPMAQHRVKPAHLPTGGRDGTDGVEGKWNVNRGGASRTERGKI